MNPAENRSKPLFFGGPQLILIGKKEFGRILDLPSQGTTVTYLHPLEHETSITR